MKRRTLLLTAVVCVVALATLAYLLFSAGRTVRSTQTSPTTEPPASASPVPPPGESAGNSRRLKQQPELPGAAAAARRTSALSRDLGALAAQEYRERARLPEFTQPLEGRSDPVADAYEVSPARAGGPEGEEPILVAFPVEVSFEAPQPVIVRAYFIEEGRPVAAEGLVARFIHERAGEVARVEMNDAGREGDDVAGDLVYSARFVAAADRLSELRGTYVVAVRGRTAELVERAVSTGFLYSVPLAHPTGRFRDRIADGNLVLEAEIDVIARGRFHAEATLATEDGRTVAWAQSAAGFESGRHWLAITFYGLVFRDAAAGGPFVVRSFALSTVGGMPNQKNRLLRNAYWTAAYRVEDFTSEPFEDPELVEAARRAEGSVPPAAPRADPSPR